MEISRKEFETYLRVKVIIERNSYEGAYLWKMVRDIDTPLIIHSDDIEPKRYEYLLDTAKDIGVSKQPLMYAFKKRRPPITRMKGGTKVFYIEWLE